MKKHLMRMLSLLLAAMIVCNVFLPALPQGVLASAAAEETAAAQAPAAAYALPQEPLGQEQQSGEWRYALRAGDGYAVITGYDGTSAHPAAPAMLGGTDVVGLASGAFSHALEGVTLHGNILWIADEAFGSSHPVVHALNGTYALYWADQNGFAWVNTSEGVFQPDVVDFSDAPQSRVRRRGDTYVQLGALEAKRVSVGSIFWMKDARGAVFFYRITELAQQGAGALATVEVPDVGDAVRELELTQTIELDMNDFVPAEGVVPVGESVQSRSTTSYTEPMETKTYNINARWKKAAEGKKLKKGQKITNYLDFEGVYTASGSITYTVEVKNNQIVYYETTENTKTTIDIAIKGKKAKYTEEELNDKIKELADKLTDTFEIGSVPIATGFFKADIKFLFGFEYQGTVSGSFSMLSSTTQVYDFDKEEWVVTDSHADNKADENSFSIGASFELKGFVEVKTLISVFSLVNVLEISIRGGISGIIQGNSDKDCLSIIIRPFAEIKIYIGLWSKWGDADIGSRTKIVDKALLPETIELVHFHIALQSPVFHMAVNCPFGASCTVKFLPRNGQTFENMQVIRGYPINPNAPHPMETEKTGKFLGWSTDINATEPNFEIGQYDGTPVTSNLTLYGVWQKTIKVSFVSEGGVVVDPQYVPAGGLVAEPPKPERDGYTFVGWYLGSTSSQRQWRFDTDVVPAEGLTLYAMWRNDTTGSITDSQGTSRAMYIGESGFFVEPYQDTAEYFNYTIQKIGGELIGVSITSLKSNATHVRIPNYMVVDVDSSNKTDYRNLKVLSFDDSMFRAKENLISVAFDYSGSDYYTSSMFRGCTNLQYVDMRNIQMSSVSDSMFSNCSSLRTVIFPAGIKSIDSSAFSNCKSLPSVKLIEGIGSIGHHAFSGCSGMTQLELGSVQSIGYRAFANCVNLQELYIPDSVRTLEDSGAFVGCTNLRKISVGGVKTLTQGMLLCDSAKLEELTIRGTINSIGQLSFYSSGYNYGMSSSTGKVRVVIEEGVTSIGYRAFYGCTGISELLLPASLVSIDQSAFDGCNGINSIIIADGAQLTNIGAGAFYGCKNLLAITLPDSLKTIGYNAFYGCSSMIDLDLGNGVQSIGYGAFANCVNLQELYIPDSVQTLDITSSGNAPFVGCTSLRKISVGGFETLPRYVLNCGSTQLEELTIRGTVRTIAASALSSSSSLNYGLSNPGGSVRVVIEEGVASIGSSAFYGCTGISELILPSTLTNIDSSAFSSCTGLKTVTYADSDQSISIGTSAFNHCTSLEVFDFPTGLTSIGNTAFSGCAKLRSVELPDSLKTIGSSAFSNCSSIEYLDLGAGVQTINANAFANCTSLTDLYIPDSVQTLSVASSKGPFASCTGLQTISVGGVETLSPYMLMCGSTQLEKLTIRGTVKTIAASAFSSSSLYNYGLSTPGGRVRVIIEEGVTSIGASAFAGCTGISELVLPSTLTNIGTSAFSGCTGLETASLPDQSALSFIGTSAFSGCKKLQSANLSTTVLTTLGGSAFSGCTGLKTVTLPDTLKTIPTNAFYNCSGMEHLDLGQGVQTINYNAFANCSSLRELYLPDSLRTLSVRSSYGSSGYTYYTPFAGCTGLKKISVGGLDTLSPYMLHTGSTQLEELTIRSTVRLIDQKCFAPATHTNGLPNATKINYGLSTPGGNVRVVIEEGVYIHTSAFSGCSGISEVVLASGVTVGPTAFSGCSGLRHVYLPSTVKTFYSNTFDRGTDLVVHVIGEAPNYVTFLTENGVAVSTSAEVPYTLTLNANGGEFAGGVHMQAQTVCWLSTLPSLRTPQNGDKLFCGWFTDEACTLPFTGDTMPARSLTLYAGWDLNVYTVTLHLMGGTLSHALTFKAQAGTNPVDGLVPVLENRGFTGWYTDRYASVPFDGVMPKGDLTLYAGYIKSGLNGEYAFANGEATLTAYHMVELESDTLYLPETVNGMPLTAIGPGAFADQSIRVLVLPAGLKTIDPQAFEGLASLERIEVRAGNAAFAAPNGVLYSADGTTLVHYPAKAARTVALPRSVRAIGAYAFAQNPITRITFSEGLESIGEHAFSGAGLRVIDLPQSLTSLGAYAFSECENLLLVRCGDGIEAIGEGCFSGCSGFMSMFGPVAPSVPAAYAEASHILYNYYTLTLAAQKTTQRQVQAGAALSLPAAPETGENTYFAGWYETAGFSGEPVETGVAMPRGDLTLYAKALPVFAFTSGETITLTGWDPGCGQTDVTIPSAIGGTPVTAIAAGCFSAGVQRITVPDSVSTLEEGWLPEGWTGEIVANEGSAAALYAQTHQLSMSALTYPLALHANGGASLPDAQAVPGTLLALPVPVRTGYAFTGWYEDSALTQPVSLDENGLFAMPCAAAALYAAWTVADEAAAHLTFTYEETAEGTIHVTGLADGETALLIPETLHGLPVTAIRDRAFAYETALRLAVIPGSIRSVPASAFAGCTSLASVTLGEGVKRLEDSCFAMCSALRALALPDTLETIGSEALADTALAALHLPAQLSLIASDALSGADSLSAITVSGENAFYHAESGVLYDLAEAKLVRYPAARTGRSYQVKDGTYVIGSYAFEGAPLETIVLPDTVLSLERAAFAGCRKLEDLPNLQSPLLTRIPESAFAGCYALQEITIPANIRTIERDAFAACVNLAAVHMPKTVTELTGQLFSSASVTLVGESGSAAQRYAQANGLLFVDPDATRLPESIALSHDTLVLQRGETALLTAAIQPENADAAEVAWYSSNAHAVAVSASGSLRALAAGVSTITAVTANGLTATCEVTVDAAIPVDGIILNAESVELLESTQVQLTAAIQPANATAAALVWSSDDEAVCTVDENGLITAHAHGTAVVRAAAPSGLTAACEVRVQKRVQSIELSIGSLQWQPGDKAAPGAAVFPADAENPALRWSVSPSGIAEVDANGQLTFLKPGFVTLTATAADLGTVSASVVLECEGAFVLTLPEKLTEIRQEAFRGAAVQAVVVPDGAVSIGEWAFADCAGLYKAVIPDSVEFIADNAFEGTSVTIVCCGGSYAQQWAERNGVDYWRR